MLICWAIRPNPVCLCYRSGVSRARTRQRWMSPPMGSSTEETVTSSSTTTATPGARATSSTCGEESSPLYGMDSKRYNPDVNILDISMLNTIMSYIMV